VHISETCEEDAPHLITHVATTAVTTTDEAMTETIHADLEQTDLTPRQHLLDSGYITAPILVSSQQQYGIEVIGPARVDVKWQANTEQGIDASQFAIDWERQQAVCPEGERSISWTPAIDVENPPLVPHAIRESALLFLEASLSCQQIFEKQGAQNFHWLPGQSSQKARERRTSREAISSEKRHEGIGKGMQVLVEGFQCTFGTYGVPEEHGHQVNHVVVAQAAGKAHALTDGGKDTLLAKVLSQQGDFVQPGRRRRNRLRRGLEDHRSISDTVHGDLLDENGFVLPH